MKILIPALLLTASIPAFARVAMSPSKTFAALMAEEVKDPAALPRSEDAKASAGKAFTGEDGFSGLTVKPGDAGTAQDLGGEKPAPPKTAPPSYHFEGTTPIKGINIYTPVKDKGEDDQTTGPERKKKDLIDPRLTYGALGLGLAATIGGFFFAPLWFLGGLALGIGGLLWFINKKFSQ